MTPKATVSAAFQVEAAIIGAGAIGLAAALALSRAGVEVLLIDRAKTIASETSSRNSEVIHAGIYYPSQSRKARLCVEGKVQLYEYCQERNIPYRQCGKLIVATNRQQQIHSISELQQQAIDNGVADTRILSKEDVYQLEPSLKTHGGLLSPSTGVLDSHSFFVSMLSDAEKAGTTVALRTSVEDACIEPNEPYPIRINAGGTWLACRTVINSAGLWASQIASLFHTESKWQPPKQYFAKGTYFRLASSAQLFKHLVYPIPEPGGLGVHATIDFAGQSLKFGPDVEWMDQTVDLDHLDLKPDLARGDTFYAEIRKYWPHLPPGSLVPDYCGFRPKLSHPSMLQGKGRAPFHDFAILDQKQHGIPGLIHLFGIESPGLTSSLAIGNHIARLVTEHSKS